MKKHWLPEEIWHKIKQYTGIYNIKNLDYTKIKRNIPITFLIHNFKKFNDPKYTSKIHEVNVFGNKLPGPIEYSFLEVKRINKVDVLKEIAKGYTSREFYEAMYIYMNKNSTNLLDTFYKHPSAFVYRRAETCGKGLLVLRPQPCTKGYVLKPWISNRITDIDYKLYHYLTEHSIEIEYNKLSEWDRLLLNSKYFGNLKLYSDFSI